MHPKGGKYDSDKELLPEGWEDYNGEDVYFDDDSDSESDEDSSFEDDECDSDVALSSVSLHIPLCLSMSLMIAPLVWI